MVFCFSPSQVPSLYGVAGGETDEDHSMWAFCLAVMTRNVQDILPDIVADAGRIIADRVRAIEPEENAKIVTESGRYQLIWWKNYTVRP